LGLAADASLTPTLQCYGSGGWYGFKTNSSFIFFNDENTNKNSHTLDIDFPICSNSMPWTTTSKTIIGNHTLVGIMGLFIGNTYNESTIINYMLALNYTCFELYMTINIREYSIVQDIPGSLSFSNDTTNIKNKYTDTQWTDIPVIDHPYYWSIQSPKTFSIDYTDSSGNLHKITNKIFPQTTLIVDSGTNGFSLPLGFTISGAIDTKIYLTYDNFTLEIQDLGANCMDGKCRLAASSKNISILGAPLWYTYPNIIFNTKKENNALIGTTISFGKPK
jgi:hypothetical protein